MSRTTQHERGLYSRPNKDGQRRWYVRASVHGRMQHFGSFDSKTKAREFYARAKTLGREQRLTPGQTVPIDYTVPELFTLYLPQAAHRLAAREQQRFADWWTAYWPTRRVFDLTPQDLEQARVALRTSGRLSKRSEGTVNHYLKCLRHAMRAVIQPRSWVVDLWSQIRLDRPAGTPPTPMMPGDERRLLAHLAPADATKVRLALLTGLRRAQLFRLRWEHLFWKQAAVALPTIKHQRPRFLPLPPEALVLLRRQWRRTGQPTQGWVFPHATQPDLPEDPASWYKYRFKPALTRAGLTGKGLTFHSTRHAFAVRFLEAGGHVRQLQKAGGWSSLDQVEIYTQMDDEGLRDAMTQGAKIGFNSRKLQTSARSTPRKRQK
ncbi:MAG: site-specific integrase [Chloroflexota bacterium]|jgi:integrase